MPQFKGWDGLSYNCRIDMSRRYSNGRIAVQLINVETHEPFSVASVNIPDAKLEKNEICMKFWSENELIREDLLKTGLFVDTGKRIPTGFVEAEVWRLK